MASKPGRLFPVLLSGGSGVRLWPLSRKETPKQLIQLIPGRTLFQRTALRVCDEAGFEPITVICAGEQRFMVAEQLRELGVPSPVVVTEPLARNTAAAAAVAALSVHAMSPDGLVLLMPTDHMIINEGALRSALLKGAAPARDGFITLFGIRPDSPATGYGYIRIDPAKPVGEDAFRAAAFVEKPDRATAEAYFASKEYVWNSGIVLARAATLLAEFARFEPELLEAARDALGAATRDADFLRLAANAYARCRSVAFDHAVLERSERIAVMPVEFGWRDVGTWSALWEASDRDDDDNVLVGNVVTEATRGAYIRSEGPLVATLGVEDVIVVATGDAVLIAAKDRDQDVRKIVERIEKMQRVEPEDSARQRTEGANVPSA